MRSIALAIVALTFVVSVASADEKKAAELIQKAIALDSNKNQEKINLYTLAIQENSVNYLPFSNRAVCYLNYGLWDKAIEDATTAIGLAPENSHPWGVRGRAFAGKREFEKAFSDLNKALEYAKSKEETRNLHNDRGNANFSARKYEEAIKDYTVAVNIETEETDKPFAKGYNNLGIAYRAKGDLDNAFQNLQIAITKDPKSARALVNRARVYVARNDPKMANSDYDNAIALDPEDATAYLDRGMFFYLNNQFVNAKTDFQTAFNKQPENAYTAIYRYLTATRLELEADGKAQLEQYVKARTQTDFWPMPVILYFLDRTKEDQVIEAANSTNGSTGGNANVELEKRERLAEAYYFIAQRAAARHEDNRTKSMLSKAVEQRSPRVQEFVMAGITLDGWSQPVPPPPRPVPSGTHIRVK